MICKWANTPIHMKRPSALTTPQGLPTRTMENSCNAQPLAEVRVEALMGQSPAQLTATIVNLH